MFRYVALTLTAFIAFGAGRATLAAETWTCTTVLGNGVPDFVVIYTVNGQTLMPSKGIARWKILMNDDNLLIAFSVFKAVGVNRHARNIGTVEVDEPVITYLIFDKARNRLLRLEDLHIAMFSDEFRPFGSPIDFDPTLERARCTRGQ
jgi:hypothetical protein